MDQSAKLQGYTESSSMVARETMTQRLQRERDQCKARLDELDGALKELNDNPDVQRVIDTLSKITHF